jgi:hypothetical protein
MIYKTLYCAGRPKGTTKLSFDEIETTKVLYQSGFNCLQLSKIYNVSWVTMKNYLSK